MSQGTYLDYNATAKLRPEASDAALRGLDLAANPSSTHAHGRAARALIEAARVEVASLVGAASAAVTFTSGGTEANALAIESAVAAGIERILTGATEHDAVRTTALSVGVPVEIWPVDGNGVADLAWLERALANASRTLVCLMLANNETGVIQPVAEAARLAKASGAWLHVDAVQAAGKIAIDMPSLGADTLALSGHKLGGPQGAGALIAGPGARISRRLHGGGQERGLRAGTENVPGIAGLGAAATAARRDMAVLQGQAAWRDRLAARLAGCGAVVLGAGAQRLPQTLCIATPGFAADTQVISLDLAGVMISAGAACSSGKVRPSEVVTAMGRPDLAPFSVRISGGWASTAEDWMNCGDAWLAAHERLAARRREYA
jgi:cysteine desulfurase